MAITSPRNTNSDPPPSPPLPTCAGDGPLDFFAGAGAGLAFGTGAGAGFAAGFATALGAGLGASLGAGAGAGAATGLAAGVGAGAAAVLTAAGCAGAGGAAVGSTFDLYWFDTRGEAQAKKKGWVGVSKAGGELDPRCPSLPVLKREVFWISKIFFALCVGAGGGGGNGRVWYRPYRPYRTVPVPNTAVCAV